MDRRIGTVLLRVARTLARVLLTLFVVGQFLFLLASNFLGVEEPQRNAVKNYVWGSPPRDEKTVWYRVKHGVQAAMEDSQPPGYFEGKGPVQEEYFPAVRKYTKRWSQLTGQPENWGLFAPNVGEIIPFPAVELRWDDQDWPDWAGPAPPAAQRPGPVVVLSDNEPRDRRCYFKFGLSRIRKYEEQITTPYPPAQDGVFFPDSEEWQKRVADKVENDPEALRNYIRWRTAVYLRAHAELPPPTQAVLLVRAFQVPKPPGPGPWDWYDLGEHRVARWLPAAPLDADKYQAVERYNPVKRSFERVEKPVKR